MVEERFAKGATYPQDSYLKVGLLPEQTIVVVLSVIRKEEYQRARPTQAQVQVVQVQDEPR